MNEAVLYVEKEYLLYKSERFVIEDLFTEEFYTYSDSVAEKYYTGKFFDNVMYMYFIQNILACAFFIRSKNITRVRVIEKRSRYLRYVLDAASITNTHVEGDACLRKKNDLYCYLMMQATRVYLSVKQLNNLFNKYDFDYSKDVCVIRKSPAARQKIKKKVNRIFLYEDDIGTGSLYTFLPIRKRVALVNDAYSMAKETFKILGDYLEKWDLCYTAYLIREFYAKRVVHTHLYGLLIEELLKLPWRGHFITGDNLDGYAIVAEKAAHSNGIRVEVIPHGMECGFRFPAGYIGDVCYTTSANAEYRLNLLYDTSKFVFDDMLAKEMFSLKYKNENRRVVYFSEPREAWVNIDILKELHKILHKAGIELFIKHHPKDNLDDYKQLSFIPIIDDLKDAICGNVCIARKSTILLECLYNDAIPAAILVNTKDRATFYTFPSLQDEGIHIFDDVSMLSNWIIDEVKL